MSKYKIILGKSVLLIWEELIKKARNESLNRSEKDLYKKLKKAFEFLETDPKHPGLKTHEITTLSQKYGLKVFQSYIENKQSSARRLFWIYGYNKNEITIVGLEQHPPSTPKGYQRIKLSL